jgi:hypothetical protein
MKQLKLPFKDSTKKPVTRIATIKEEDIIGKARELKKNWTGGFGLTKFLGVHVTACIIAIEHGHNYAHSISRFFNGNLSPTTAHRCLVKLEERFLIEKIVEKEGKLNVGMKGHVTVPFKLTSDGQIILDILRGSDVVYNMYSEWLEINGKIKPDS